MTICAVLKSVQVSHSSQPAAGSVGQVAFLRTKLKMEAACLTISGNYDQSLSIIA